MIPRLHSYADKEFKSNGLGLLKDSYDWHVEEEDNSTFTATFKYPVTGRLLEDLRRGNIVRADASKRLKNQKFRIRKVTKVDDECVEVYCEHKSFDLVKDFMPVSLSIENQSCEYCLNEIFANCDNSKYYKGYSDIVNSQTFKISYVTPAEAIQGHEGSIIDTFGNGAKIERDNSVEDAIYVKQRRGRDTGVLLAYGKNITGFKAIEDDEKLYTRIYPFATYNDENQEEVVFRPSYGYVDADNAKDFYGEYFIKEQDFSDRLADDQLPTDDLLKQFAKDYYRETSCNIPIFSYDIDFQILSETNAIDTNLISLYDIGIGDTVCIWHKVHNLRTEGKVSYVDYDPINEQYNKVTIGDIRASLDSIFDDDKEDNKGEDGKTFYTWIKYADTPTSGMSDYPDGKAYIGIASNQSSPTPSDDYSKYKWSKIKNEAGDMPDELPPTSILSGRGGLNTISLSWTFDNKMYYSYELYGSQTADFTPSSFNLLYKGQASSYVHMVEPSQTWYYRVRCTNSHGASNAFSNQCELTTTKIEDAENYFKNAAISNALIGELDLGRGWFGQLKGNHMDVRLLTLTDGNGKRVIYIDDFGRAYFDVTELKINAQSVYTGSQVNEAIEGAVDNIDIGGSNIARNTSLRDNTEHFSLNDGTTRYTDLKTPYNNYCFKHEQSGNTGDVQNGAYQYTTHVHVGMDYTFSCNAFIPAINNIDKGYKMSILCCREDASVIESHINDFDLNIVDSWQRMIVQIRIPEGTKYIVIRTYIVRNGVGYDGDWMLEEGNKASSWDNSSLDLDDLISQTKTDINDIINSNTESNKAIWEQTLKNALSNYLETGKYDEILEIVDSKITQSASSIDMVFNTFKGQIENTVDGLIGTTEEMQSYIRFDIDGILLGKSTSPFTIKITNERIQFLENNREVAYLSNNKLVITEAYVKNSLRIGGFMWVPRDNGGLDLLWKGYQRMTSCHISEHEIYLAGPGYTARLYAMPSPADADDADGLYFESDKPSVATVTRGGLVTAMSPGEALISIRDEKGEQWNTCVVEVGNSLVE